MTRITRRKASGIIAMKMSDLVMDIMALTTEGEEGQLLSVRKSQVIASLKSLIEFVERFGDPEFTEPGT